MNDPADQWDSPLSQPTGRPSAFFKANTAADEKIADLAALRARLDADDAKPEWKPLAAGIAMMVDRYYAAAADADQEAAIVNLASLLRHASAFASALSREVKHYAADARDANERAREAQDRVVALTEENAKLVSLLMGCGIENDVLRSQL